MLEQSWRRSFAGGVPAAFVFADKGFRCRVRSRAGRRRRGVRARRLRRPRTTAGRCERGQRRRARQRAGALPARISPRSPRRWPRPPAPATSSSRWAPATSPCWGPRSSPRCGCGPTAARPVARGCCGDRAERRPHRRGCRRCGRRLRPKPGTESDRKRRESTSNLPRPTTEPITTGGAGRRTAHRRHRFRGAAPARPPGTGRARGPSRRARPRSSRPAARPSGGSADASPTGPNPFARGALFGA